MEARRAEWARRCNVELSKIGVVARIDHRSLKRRAEASEGPKVVAKPRHMGQALTAVRRRHERSMSCAQQRGERPPQPPQFLVSSKKRRGALIRARMAWIHLLKEVDDWLDNGSPSLETNEVEDLVFTIIRAGTQTVRNASKPIPKRRMSGSEAIRLLAANHLQKKRTKYRGR